MKKNTALILCDGEPPDETLFRRTLGECRFFAATDGAAWIALKYDVLPDIVIGDMDAFVAPAGFQVPILKDPDQETNDLEKALMYLQDQEFRNIRVLGATGRRLDHTLKNLSVLKKFHSRFDSLIFEDTYAEIVLLPRTCIRKVKPRTVISLFPLSGKAEGIVSRGLKYPLNNESLENGVRDGSSNEATGTEIEISHTKGDLLMFVGKEAGNWQER